MKLYYPKSHYKPDRRQVFPLLRPFIKNEDFSDKQRIQLYGVSAKDFEFTTSLKEADVVILTMAWNYYINTGQLDFVVAFINKCKSLDKKVFAVNTGDFGMRIPPLENLFVLRSSGYKSRFSPNEFTLPPIIKDPLKTYFNRETVMERPFLPKPVIGFCGQANSSPFNAAKEILNIARRNMLFQLGLSRNEPQQLLSSSYLRATILKNLQQSPLVTCNFIPRKHYRAGITANKDKHKTTLEFYQNLKDSDYVLCVRGAGNFSIRFYEALAMGRIPVFINTDCVLPFDRTLDWKKHVVWVEYQDRSKVAQKVADFHSALSDRDFIDLQYANRKLWEERLTLLGFFKTTFQ